MKTGYPLPSPLFNPYPSWINIVYDYGYKFSYIKAFTFFLSFHLIVNLLLLSLMQGLIWEVFVIVDQDQESKAC